MQEVVEAISREMCHIPVTAVLFCAHLAVWEALRVAQHGLTVTEACAETGQGVKELFQGLAQYLYDVKEGRREVPCVVCYYSLWDAVGFCLMYMKGHNQKSQGTQI